jgi:hypothetical protein
VNKVFFPLEEQLGVHENHWSEIVVQQAIWLYGQVEDDLGEQILQKMGGLPISDTRAWRRCQPSQVTNPPMPPKSNSVSASGTSFGAPGAGVVAAERITLAHKQIDRMKAFMIRVSFTSSPPHRVLPLAK